MGEQLKEALKESFMVEIETTDVIMFQHNYCENTIVDVVIIDSRTGKSYCFPLFNTELGFFL